MAARESSSSAVTPSTGLISVTLNTPFVNVPVLSKTTVSSLFSASRKFPPLTKIPFLAAPPIPPKKLIGIEITKAQGQEIIRKDSALYSHSENAPKPNNGGKTATANAVNTTAGV